MAELVVSLHHNLFVIRYPGLQPFTDHRSIEVCPHASHRREPPELNEKEVMRASIEIRAIIFHKQRPLDVGVE